MMARAGLTSLPTTPVFGESGRVDRQQWDERYSGDEFEWSMHPNQFVAAELTGVPPGRALDLAAGEGRNSVWLAEQGWSVTAVDFSRVGLEKGRKLSAVRGVGDSQVDWVVADLREYEPARAAFELVLIAYLQVDAALRAQVLAGAAAALVPGGTLLVVGHDLTNLTEGVGQIVVVPAETELLAGGVEAGTVEAGTVDAGTVDAGTVDAGTVDAGTVDAGTVDAGTVDAGTADA